MNSGTCSASAQFDDPGSSDALDALPPDATAEKANQWNKNTLVWLRAPRTLVLDELLLAAPLSSSCRDRAFCRSLLRLLWILPAGCSNPARLPFVLEPGSGAHPAWLNHWFSTKKAQEWEWVEIEEEEEKEKVVNSKPKTEHVTNLGMLARLRGLEESNLL